MKIECYNESPVLSPPGGAAVARQEEEPGADGDRVGVLRRLLAPLVRRHHAPHLRRQHRRRWVKWKN